MTDHQRARRAAKSKAFFAKLAERAAIDGDKPEALRLLVAATRKRTEAKIAGAILTLAA